MNQANKLKNEKSPYLLQHQYNPVNWYPWSEEAFLIAKADNKPICLSIGYSTCHWCHVMAHESFEDQEVADILNEKYISIKVDREERPDVDSIYMSVCQALTGSGGWPLTVFIEYDKKPIFAGTYYPKQTFIRVLAKISELWEHDRNNININAEKIIKAISQEDTTQKDINTSLTHKAYHQFNQSYDDKYGGFTNAPKFPTPHNLIFLMKYYQTTKQDHAMEMVVNTLEKMRQGGIYDHIGFGFCRYSTDQKWLVPHFEKMLYDNVLLMIAYLYAYELTNYALFKQTVLEIISYLQRKMIDCDGGFYTAEDADSEGEEGKFYVFTPNEIDQILCNQAHEFCDYFQITEEGNYEGNSIPNRISKDINYSNTNIESSRKKVFEYQNMRIHPLKDDKILTSINGLAIAAFAIAGRILKNKTYINIAKQAVLFIKNFLYKDGKLLARYRDHEARFLGFSEDYAYLVYGLIELYQASFDDQYLEFAISLNKTYINHFYDPHGGFYLNDDQSETILFRKKEIYDGATPSANAVAVYNNYRLAALTDDLSYNIIADKTLEFFINDIESYPSAYSFSCINLLVKEFGIIRIHISVLEQGDEQEMIKVIEECNLPFTTIRVINDCPDYPSIDNLPTAYICKDICLQPINDVKELHSVLEKGI